MRILLLSLITVLSLTACREGETSGSCEGREWNDTWGYLDCKYPNPPVGRWHAVYTKEFAEKYNLPPENISTDFSQEVDYMEMEVLSYGDYGISCMANMLVKKPHDIALYDSSTMGVPSFSKRKLLHLINIDDQRGRLKQVSSFDTASRDYNRKKGAVKKGYRDGAFSLFIEDVLSGYDYITADAECKNISMHPKHFPDKYAFWVAKASVWGRYEKKYPHIEDVGRPHGDDFYNSHFFINIPRELPQEIFKNVPIRGVRK